MNLISAKFINKKGGFTVVARVVRGERLRKKVGVAVGEMRIGVGVEFWLALLNIIDQVLIDLAGHFRSCFCPTINFSLHPDPLSLFIHSNQPSHPIPYNKIALLICASICSL